ncbi:uncharacterized protein K460DRAFT_82815 [Cucurbitaria berberidis CBS 394.84]|uniref:Uncharacterized protein n=1 Tax=Cucurbitaria berberidis CBS 394.84 TaxID=1168544 RepID=A0A9P4GPF4_9PLEO|nr:uncharacterized protein K460DRAFT_82815 [Cucurbitaria berberidis CBS 394.84]KAF1848919.1 hypothetical protein K460DRAFT_82815 [Cucurbitaria berberidis CBS 394.84]
MTAGEHARRQGFYVRTGWRYGVHGSCHAAQCLACMPMCLAFLMIYMPSYLLLVTIFLNCLRYHANPREENPCDFCAVDSTCIHGTRGNSTWWQRGKL